MTGALPLLDSLRPNLDLAKLPLFDRKNWKRVRFGDVVENINETERNAADAGIVRFIGLEHLEPGSLHVRAWGDVANGTTFTRRCRSGQVLFGKRRAYQRKVALAKFDAVVSGDIYVLAPKNDRLLPGLLPFICMSERFFQRAVGTSAGSLSPRTNWSSLAGFEFDLPPLDQQRRIAEILCAVDEVQIEYQKLNDTLAKTRMVKIDEMVATAASGFCSKPLRDLLVRKPQYGANAPAVNLRDGMPRYIRITDIDQTGRLILTDAVGVELSKAEEEKYSLAPGDLLIARTGNTVGKSYLHCESDGHSVYAGYLVQFRPNQKAALPEYLFQVTQSSYYRRWIENTVRVGAQPNVNGTEYASLLIPVPPLSFQSEKIADIDKLSRAILECERYIQTSGLVNSSFFTKSFTE